MTVASLFSKRRGFTIVELLVASAVFMVLLTVVVGVINQTSRITKRAADQISSFQNARAAYDLLIQSLSQATLNSYWDYDHPNAPAVYLRKSELHFLITQAGGSFPGTAGTGQAVFFQAPMGMTASDSHYGGLNHLLSSVGYYIKYSDDEALPAPFALPPRYRYRLMQALEPTEELAVYRQAGSQWVAGLTTHETAVAENIIFMAIWPRKSLREDPVGNALTSDFTYDSRFNHTQVPQLPTANQLPPLLHVVMVAVDEQFAERFCISNTPPEEITSLLEGLFETASEAEFNANLSQLEQSLTDAGVSYRTFSSMIPLRESKME